MESGMSYYSDLPIKQQVLYSVQRLVLETDAGVRPGPARPRPQANQSEANLELASGVTFRIAGARALEHC